MNSRTSRPWSTDRPGVGTFVKIPSVDVIELLALAGFDFVVIDNEHASIGPETVSSMIAVARGCGLAALVRVPGHTARDIQVPLDAGAAGVMLPHVDSEAQARAAVSACRFPPLGNRGVSNSGRAGGWGQDGLSAYLATGSDVLVVAQLESRQALEDAAAIAATEGIDAVFIGPGDLAVSSGLSLDSDELRGAISEAQLACARSGHHVGVTATTGELAAQRIADGFHFVVIGTDTALLRTAAAQAVQLAAPRGR
ncbi:aldolase/citrate lyase family protein [Streptomyces longwoodensis]|uniref:HpcH/HpaI aldolase family protein n=1 Tax=Streptomyces longwoodensis TaxID=68231 RepID=UPI0033C269A5